RDLQQKLCREITALQDAVARGMPWQSEWELSQAEAATARECGLEPLCQTLLQLGHMDPNTPPAPVAKPPSMVSDAFTNPGYIRYALKTLLA
ncbi:multidrug transporter subunit MdtO, partial [Bacillus thuringiensis]|nr:multidrug transporter subunit MdtO [Bacillus thuringiensis]